MRGLGLVKLNLPQELLLLSYQEEKALVFHTPLSVSLAGAVLAELLIQKKIGRSGPHLRYKDHTPSADPILDDALSMLALSPEERTARFWVNRLHSAIKLRARLTEQLAAKGLLSITQHASIGPFSFKSYFLADPHPALKLKDQLRQVIFEPFKPTTREMALIGLVEPVGLKLFTREERRAAKARFGEILKRDAITDAVAGAIADAEGVAAAIVAASAAAAG